MTALLANTLEAQSVAISRSNPDSVHGFSASAAKFSNFELSGTGSLTISIPYLLDIGAEDGFVATGSLGIDTYSYFDPEPNRSDSSWGRTGVPNLPDVPWYINYDGTPRDQGILAITLQSHGAPSIHEFRSWTYVGISSAVPEAETFAMIGLGLFALILARRRLADTDQYIN